MKKTLAILIALLMSASVALVSCGGEGEEGADTTGNPFNQDFSSQAVTETDEDGSVVVVPETNEDGENDEPDGSNNMETVNDKVYALCSAVIREEQSVSSDEVGTVPFKATLNRSERYQRWSKVKYTDASGNTIEGYIANDLITTNEKSVQFVEQKTETTDSTETNENGETTVVSTAVKSNIKSEDALGFKNAVIRKYPLAYSDDFEVLEEKEFNAWSRIAQIPAGTEVEVVSVSADGKWAYVKGKGNKMVNGEFPENPVDVEGYTAYSNLAMSGSNAGDNSGDAIG